VWEGDCPRALDSGVSARALAEPLETSVQVARTWDRKLKAIVSSYPMSPVRPSGVSLCIESLI